VFEINGKQIVGQRTISPAGRLRVELQFDKADVELFDWQIYSPEELIEVAASTGLSLVLACSAFDETKPASDQTARYQLVLQRQ
jgi:hypothetical protein